MGRNIFFRNFTSWEYWPTFMFYGPNIPYAIFLAFKARNFSFYSATNPGIKSSGNGTESKYATLKHLEPELIPKTLYVPSVRYINEVVNQMGEKGISFPLIAKPDVGFRGLFVEKIKILDDLRNYLETTNFPILIQEFIELPNECGIFYHRFPNDTKGNISSITLKSFLTIIGDGFSKLRELIQTDDRAKHYVNFLSEVNKERLDSIPKMGESVQISDIGNHCKGTTFINGNHLIDDKLVVVLDKINVQLEGWYYGRLDVKYNTFEELLEGKNFKILEINGIISEPTHIYDPTKGTYFGAIFEIQKYWRIVYKIATQNHQNGIPYMKFFKFWKEIGGLLRYAKDIKKLSKTKS